MTDLIHRAVPTLPIKNSVLFPYLIMPLAVGRPRSVAAVEAALAKEDKPRLKSVLRRLQPYLVGITKKARDKVVEEHAAEIIDKAVFGDQFIWLTDAGRYRDDVGLVLSAGY